MGNVCFIIDTYSEKVFYFFWGFRGRYILDNLCFVWVGAPAVFIQSVAQESDLLFEEVAFLYFQFEVCMIKALKDFLKANKVFRKGGAVAKYVVNIQ